MSYGKRERFSDDENEDLGSAKTTKTVDVPCKQVQDLLDELDDAIEVVASKAGNSAQRHSNTTIVSGMTTLPDGENQGKK